MEILRKIMGVAMIDFIRNDQRRKYCMLQTIVNGTQVRRRQLNKHLYRKSGNITARIVRGNTSNEKFKTTLTIGAERRKI